MKHLKMLLIGLIVGVLFATAGTGFAAELIEKVTASIRTDYNVELDGQKAELQNAPLVYNGTSYLPVRELATMLGKDVGFEDGTIKLDTPKEEKTVNNNIQNRVTEKPVVIGSEFELGDVKLKVNSISYSNLAAYESGGSAGFVPNSGEKFVLINFDVFTSVEPIDRFAWSANDFISHIIVDDKMLHGANSTGESMKINPNELKTVEVFISIPEHLEVSAVYFKSPNNFLDVGKLIVDQ